MSHVAPLFSESDEFAPQERILILAPTGRDAFLVETVLNQGGIHSHSCADMAQLCCELSAGAGAVLLAEEALPLPGIEEFQSCLTHQEPWSDLPLLVLTSGGYSSRTSLDTVGLLEASCNVTLLERPLRRETLVSAVYAALRARRRQYEMRDLLHQWKNSVQRRDEFLAMLGHELRNPLATIRTAIELLKYDDASETELKRTRAIMERQTQHLSRLIDDLLDVARITQGKISLKLQSLDLNEVVRRCIQSLEVAGETQKHTLKLALWHQPVVIEGDAVRLEQIFNNLLTNALKYTPPGGRITMKIAVEEGEAVVRVQDTGLGIDPELQPHIFDLFTQAKRSLDRSQGGLGIGLTVTHGLVQMHGGQICVRSDGLQKGSEFEVRLPLLEGATVAAATPQGEAVTEAGQRILLVEDNADARLVMKIMLQQHGYQVNDAADGPEGVAAALEFRPEIALIDIGLPGIDGYEVARRLRATFGSTLFLIALTGYGQADDQTQALQAGFDVHLTKPVEPQLLYRVLHKATQAEKTSPALVEAAH
jgi:two-component system, sensor histidine kinase